MNISTELGHVTRSHALRNVNMIRTCMWHGARRHQNLYDLTLYLHRGGKIEKLKDEIEGG